MVEKNSTRELEEAKAASIFNDQLPVQLAPDIEGTKAAEALVEESLRRVITDQNLLQPDSAGYRQVVLDATANGGMSMDGQQTARSTVEQWIKTQLGRSSEHIDSYTFIHFSPYTGNPVLGAVGAEVQSTDKPTHPLFFSNPQARADFYTPLEVSETSVTPN